MSRVGIASKAAVVGGRRRFGDQRHFRARQQSGHCRHGGRCRPVQDAGGGAQGGRSGCYPESTGPFTVFAPTDEAFAKLPAGTVEDLLKPENKAKLTAILTYHVVPGAVKAEQVTKLDQAKTVNGAMVKVTTKGGKVTINDATVVKADTAASTASSTSSIRSSCRPRADRPHIATSDRPPVRFIPEADRHLLDKAPPQEMRSLLLVTARHSVPNNSDEDPFQ